MLPPMFEMTGVQELFPTHLFIHQLPEETFRPLNDKLLAVLDKVREDAKLPPGKPMQTASSFHRLAEAQELVAIIEAATAGVLEFLSIKRPGFEITGCWANLNPTGTGHPRHCHPNNFLSGVYYAAVADGADTISFDDPRPHWTIMAPELEEQRPELSNTVVMTVKPGMLIVFPSWLMHYVETNTAPETRVSISFNAMFSGFAETHSPTKWNPTLPLP
jgi:uncharacterized protein (TIGR02466 family)